MILQLPICRTSLPLSPSLSNFTLANWNPLQRKTDHAFHRFQNFFVLNSTTSIRFTKSYVKPSQLNLLSSYIQIMIPYGSNMLPIKKLSLYEPLLWMLNYLQNVRWSFIFTSHLVDTTNAAVFTKKQFLLFIQFSLLYFTITCSQNHP